MVRKDFLTVRSPRHGVGVEMRNGYYDKEPRGKKRYPHDESSSSGVGMEMRNGYYDKEPCGRKRFPHRESSSIGGRGGDEGQTL